MYIELWAQVLEKIGFDIIMEQTKIKLATVCSTVPNIFSLNKIYCNVHVLIFFHELPLM